MQSTPTSTSPPITQAPTIITICTGGCELSADNNTLLMTLLGSCISVCARDKLKKIGGMNHFLLPKSDEPFVNSASMRYGTHAMEQLLNQLYQRGAQKKNMEIKIFGGANVIKQTKQIGEQNIVFVRKFLKQEGFAIATEDVGGDRGRRLIYHPVSGRVMLKRMLTQEENNTIQDEQQFINFMMQKPSEGSIDLFE